MGLGLRVSVRVRVGVRVRVRVRDSHLVLYEAVHVVVAGVVPHALRLEG